MSTGTEIVLKFKAKLNKLDTTSNRAVRPEMALLYLNDAYLKLVRAKYSANGGSETAFQFTQLTTDELDFLTTVKRGGDGVVTSEFDISYDEEFMEYSISKSDLEDYFTQLKSSIKVKSGDVTEWVSPAYKTLDEVTTTDGDPFNVTSFQEPVLYQEGNKFKVKVDDSFTVTAFSVSYLKQPTKLELDSEVDIPFEDEIIDTAVTLMLTAWGDPKAGTHYQATKATKLE